MYALAVSNSSSARCSLDSQYIASRGKKALHSLDPLPNLDFSFDSEILEGLSAPIALPQGFIAAIDWASLRSRVSVVTIDTTFADAVVAFGVDLELDVRIGDLVTLAHWTLIRLLRDRRHRDPARRQYRQKMPQVGNETTEEIQIR